MPPPPLHVQALLQGRRPRLGDLLYGRQEFVVRLRGAEPARVAALIQVTLKLGQVFLV